MTVVIALVILIAGWGAGIVTGLVGASAATIVTPILVTFLGYEAYTAITVSLLADVFASAVSSYTYHKHGNLDIKNGFKLALFAVIGSIIGSALAANVDDAALGGAMGIILLILGIRFIRESIKNKKQEEAGEDVNAAKEIKENFLTRNKTFSSIFLGLIIGLICGFVGAGGGMMILIILTAVLKYDLKTAVGTSVLIMTCTALAGGLSHIYHIAEASKAIPYVEILIASIGAMIGAKMAATYANRVKQYLMKRAAGIAFLALAVLMTIEKQIIK